MIFQDGDWRGVCVCVRARMCAPWHGGQDALVGGEAAVE